MYPHCMVQLLTSIQDFLSLSLFPHQVFEGNKPTNSIVIQKLSPYNLGALIGQLFFVLFLLGILLNFWNLLLIMCGVWFLFHIAVPCSSL